MTTPAKTLIELEHRFWQSIVDQKTDVALELLSERALMVSSHGAMQFDHAAYRKMAEQGSVIVTAFTLSDMMVVFPNDTTGILVYRVKQEVKARAGGATQTQEMRDTSTWIRTGDRWQCVMHTEAAVADRPPAGP
ncbi:MULTISPECIES: nuclear transport factor 2 family protein [Ramlibacter]|jgi:hypothetical protein|uniref:DUF4440 domain-containing protein n=1 Tax=Ramlibacter pinisoli TaxID=2682844 RepID=A0A6N8IYA5_9BURK|nr:MULTISPECIES: nuclear transport factor 2 family protein [Ramlibacter]MBA2960990.1 nuclear transport factor 2 family protein [Ramlibacter sp. CGMCC 1.13660]MVQ30936.1 DUF4440 domain-containing protein [Ramlibacter pinisoli]